MGHEYIHARAKNAQGIVCVMDAEKSEDHRSDLTNHHALIYKAQRVAEDLNGYSFCFESWFSFAAAFRSQLSEFEVSDQLGVR